MSSHDGQVTQLWIGPLDGSGLAETVDEDATECEETSPGCTLCYRPSQEGSQLCLSPVPAIGESPVTAWNNKRSLGPETRKPFGYLDVVPEEPVEGQAAPARASALQRSGRRHTTARQASV